jgi:tetratricopeptide (TPR) repeat protein
VGCLAENTILAYADGRLGAEELDVIDSHVASCIRCQRLIAAALELGTHSGRDPEPGGYRVTGIPVFGPRDALPRGTVIGRYTVLELAGRGGMGEVYAAFDAELDRKVALKVLHPPKDGDDERGRVRLLREARAMARLRHPNAVSVHDVGTYGARVFVAMEYVEGRTLDAWLAERPRSRNEILAVFAAAAQGLGAAHAAGLVHRDFKPQNVMVARDGTVRVMDFGLARTIDNAPAVSSDADDSESPGLSADVGKIDLTRTGELLGTPAYMAPEQFVGGPTDSRTDQFSFCVALYAGLYGERPFAGATFAELLRDTATGTVRPAPVGARVPAWLRRALLRGLSANPAQRFHSMEALLETLTTDPTAGTRRRVLVVIGVACVVGAVVSGQRSGGTTRSSVCQGAAHKLVGIWESPGTPSRRKDLIRAAFASTGKSYAGQAYSGAASLLDDYVGRWVAGYQDTCEATHVRGEQSAEVLDLRMACLQERLLKVRALTDVMTEADGNTVDNAIAAASALPGLDRCADVPLLKAVVQPPADVNTRERVQGLRIEEARLAALRDSGHCPMAEALAQDLIRRVRKTGYLPLLAETLSNAGLLSNDCTSPEQGLIWLREAYVAAVEARDDEAAAEAATLVSAFLAIRVHRPEEERQWLDIARASIARVGARPLLRAWWLVSEGGVLLDEGHASDAGIAYREALAIKKRELGEHNLDVIRSMNNVAFGLEGDGRLVEALAGFTNAVKAASELLGDEHPFVGQLWDNVGETLNLLGRYADARRAFERSLTILRHDGIDPGMVAESLTGLGLAELGDGHTQRAVDSFEEALMRSEHSPSSALRGEVRFGLARALWTRAREMDRERALTLARAARLDYDQVTTEYGRRTGRQIVEWLASATPPRKR